MSASRYGKLCTGELEFLLKKAKTIFNLRERKNRDAHRPEPRPAGGAPAAHESHDFPANEDKNAKNFARLRRGGVWWGLRQRLPAEAPHSPQDGSYNRWAEAPGLSWSTAQACM